MADAVNAQSVSPLGGASFEGFAKVREIGPLGMISLRAKRDVPGLEGAFASLGLALPEQRRITGTTAKGAGWMSPDEYLILVPYAEVSGALANLAQALKGSHHLAVDVSDARAVFRIEGEKAGQVVAKLGPIDVASLAPNELRRSRAAQVAAAVWAEEGGFTLVCFRSVAAYVMGLLTASAAPGAELA
ncbi:sarcosine oxidase subunit gamma [Stagnihabitans tardus]|uniref:Sarcosine oxidase subunit gamma n=1 Tax=Stagnihabitans tardus TaxID=2699202 RepID=A0AAE4Y7X4_9RHOB|nr:sarcosine oxidase subunit gamma family protein [Stagnihabitans tardus]NBZ87597.1 sarcosine oxidase subunit gamma [Stagnihabitans tardus]